MYQASAHFGVVYLTGLFLLSARFTAIACMAERILSKAAGVPHSLTL